MHELQNSVESFFITKTGEKVLLRPISHNDFTIEADFVANLSSQSKYDRFFNAIKDLKLFKLGKTATGNFVAND